jgi:hypothetical protein
MDWIWRQQNQFSNELYTQPTSRTTPSSATWQMVSFEATHFLDAVVLEWQKSLCVIRLHSSSQLITELITTARSLNPSLRCIFQFYLQQSCDDSWEALALGLKPWRTTVVGTWSAGLCRSWHLYLKSFSSPVPLELVKPHAWVSSIAETVISMNGAKTKQ